MVKVPLLGIDNILKEEKPVLVQLLPPITPTVTLPPKPGQGVTTPSESGFTSALETKPIP